MEKLTGPLWDDKDFPSQILTFALGGREYGLEAGSVRQVIRRMPLLPFRDKSAIPLVGFISYRGEQLPVIDIRKIIGFKYAEPKPENRIIIISRNRTVFGFIADSITGVLSCEGNGQKSSGGNGAPLTLHCVGNRDLILVDPLLLLTDEQEAELSGLPEPPAPVREKQSPARDKGKDRFDRILFILRKSYEKSVLNEPAPMPEDQRKILIVELGGKPCGFPLENIREVLRSASITPVPNVPPQIKGIINLRGEIISVLSLYDALGILRPARTGELRYVVTKSEPYETAITVEDIDRVVVVEKKQMEENTSSAPFVSHMIPLGSDRIPLIDLTALLKSEAMEQTTRR